MLKPKLSIPIQLVEMGFYYDWVLNPDGSAHESNGRAMIDDDDDDFWFGFEQEYFLWDPETNCLLDFQKIKLLKVNSIVLLVVAMLSVEKLWTAISICA